MDLKLPTNNQELFQEYVTAKLSVIAEWSGDMQEDHRKLKRWSDNYAEANNLFPVKVDWSIYIHDIDHLTPAQWEEYDMVALWVAKRGFHGDELENEHAWPQLICSKVMREIREYNDEFCARVKATKYALAMGEKL